MIQVLRPSIVPKLYATGSAVRVAVTRSQGAAILLCLATLPSCAPRARNLQLDRLDQTKGYRFDALELGRINVQLIVAADFASVVTVPSRI